MSSSHHFTESPTFEYSIPLNKRIDIPIRSLSNSSNYQLDEQHTQNRIHSKDTTLQWINDPTTGNEKFRIKINIEGFNQNEVRIRVDGNKLIVYGERIENKSQGISKKLIEKFYELPPDVDTFSSQVTFPSPVIMQVDFSSKYSPTRFVRSSRYSSPQQFNDSNAFSNAYIHSSYGKLPHEIRNSITSHTYRIPIRQLSNNSIDSSRFPARSISPTYQFRQSINEPQINKNNATYQQTVTETHRETHRQRSSPTTGIQSSYESEHQRSGSPLLYNTNEDHFQSNINSNRQSMTPSLSLDTNSSNNNNESSVFPRDFNSDVFYQSVFQPQIFTDDRNRRYIEMKLDMYDYNPDKIRVSINDNDLTVQVEQTNFYRQITLPSNIDLSSLSVHYHYDRKLYITIKLLDEYSSFKYI
ncbi:unnamed protein product [Rotaria sp. Silwood2]|nr:unnamed protein product [Rotaria sp. Silwood2]CAF3370059.1 unnamed protein product [Rotaria sp. Silwood2]CAF4207334.1 unnamed protein product [Rotaria sp. Silwood2]CAF4333778.1 unnamed protein product [Rotaria sp. Silwood2]